MTIDFHSKKPQTGIPAAPHNLVDKEYHTMNEPTAALELAEIIHELRVAVSPAKEYPNGIIARLEAIAHRVARLEGKAMAHDQLRQDQADASHPDEEQLMAEAEARVER